MTDDLNPQWARHFEAIGDELLSRIQTLSRLLPARDEEPEWSPFKSHSDFVQDLRHKVEIIELGAQEGLSALLDTQQGARGVPELVFPYAFASAEAAWPLRDPAQDRRGRHGRGLCGAR